MIKIHQVELGPTLIRELPEIIDEGYEIMEEYYDAAIVDVLLEEQGQYPIAGSLAFPDFNSAYEFAGHFKKSIGPIILKDDKMYYEDGKETPYGNLIKPQN